MGYLIYNGEEFDFDDRVLTHLQIVFSTKLRRNEPFFFSWAQPPERGSGRRALWVDNGVPIHIFYGGSRMPAVNREWVDNLLNAAGRAGGLMLMDEPPARD